MLIAQSYLPDVKYDDEFILNQIVVAEAYIQRQLGVYLTPREMVPMGLVKQQQAEIAALEAAGAIIEYEPGYDYDPKMFQGNTWGLIELRQKPILKIHSVTFDYPAPNQTLFTIPNDWIRADAKYGRFNLVPVQNALELPLNAFILAALGGGRTVPLMLQVRYRAGIENAAKTYPDVLDIILKEAVLSIVEDALLPTSASTSVDGLSQSLSFDAAKYRDLIDARLKRLRRAINGIQMMVM